MKVVERLLYGNGAEGAATDAQHDKGIELRTHLLGAGQNFGNDVALIMGKLAPLHTAAFVDHRLHRSVDVGLDGSDLLFGKTALSNAFFHHSVDVDADAHVLVLCSHIDPFCGREIGKGFW